MSLAVGRSEPSGGVRWAGRGVRWAEWIWVVAVLAYSATRITLAHRHLRAYGVDIRVFGVVEVVSSVPYAIGASRLVRALLQRRYRRACWWGLLAVAGFLAPDAYLLAAGRAVPGRVYVVLGTVLAVSSVLTVLGLRGQVRSGRAGGDGPAS